MSPSSSVDPNHEQTLEEFRNAWKEEVKKKHVRESLIKDKESKKGDSDHVEGLVETTESLTVNEKEPVTAMDYYIIAVDNERQGKLGKALDGYRRAFKLDPNIDFAYKKHYQNEILPSIQANKDKPQKPTEDFKHLIPIGKEYIAPSAFRKDPLADLIEQFLNEGALSTVPELDGVPSLIFKLPSEIMLSILKHLALYSVSSIPYFALVCKRFFLLTRDQSVWQYACVRVFRQPSMSLEESKDYQSNFVERYNGHWLRMFIDRPRIRYDGVYISTCNYIRPGTSDTAWNQPIHFVTYYRYIRFFPDGTLLKHVTTEEPSHVVKLLHSGYNKKQSFEGRFVVSNLNHIEIAMKDRTLPMETFHLSLDIKSTHRGRHNKLTWDRYYSTTDRLNRDGHDYDLKLLKPYFFSPVRSYRVSYPEKWDTPPSLLDDLK